MAAGDAAGPAKGRPKYPPLTPEQQRLVVENRRFAYKLARQQMNCGMQFDDIAQEALCGLIMAAQRYDGTSYRVKFTTFASYWIHAFIWKAATSDRNIVRLDTTEGRRRVEPALLRLSHKGVDLTDVDPAALAAELSTDKITVAPADVTEVLTRFLVRSGDVRLDVNAGDRSLLRTEPEVEQHLAAQQRRQLLLAAVQRVEKRDSRAGVILRERWLREEPTTLRELGQRFGISRERARQLEVKAIARVRQELGE